MKEPHSKSEMRRLSILRKDREERLTELRERKKDRIMEMGKLEQLLRKDEEEEKKLLKELAELRKYRLE
jgi:hypothetical protein